ncbi:hypothetical protein BH10PAT3_BH10PAT3_5310 [soil metagenome]
MNSDLFPAQNAGSTDNPQAAQNTPEVNDASQFQKSAGTDVLSENHPVEVAKTGRPVSGQKAAGMSASVILFIIVSSIVLLMVASSVFRWVMKRPEPVKADKTKENLKDKPEAEPKRPIEVVRPQGKKKLSRSKRNK